MSSEGPGSDRGDSNPSIGPAKPGSWIGWLAVGVLLVGTLGSWQIAWEGYEIRFVRGWAERPVQPREDSGGPVDSSRMLPGLVLTERQPAELAVVFLDVGQGDAVFVQTPAGKNLLIDAGTGGNRSPGRAGSPRAGRRVVYPFLRRNRVGELAYLIGTHPHGDHVGGIAHLLDHLSVRELWVAGFRHRTPAGERLLAAARSRARSGDVRLRTPRGAGGSLEAGKRLRLGPGVRAWLLRTNPGAESANRSSLVVLLYYGETGFLFTGDLESEGERALVRRWGDQLDVDVLKVAHHGSQTSTSRDFLDFVRPRISVVSVGRYNSFGHPTRGVLDRLRAAGSRIYRTDRHGSVYLFSDGTNLRVLHHRGIGLGDPWPVVP